MVNRLYSKLDSFPIRFVINNTYKQQLPNKYYNYTHLEIEGPAHGINDKNSKLI